MTDRELLESAARAGGYCLEWRHMGGGRYATAIAGSPQWTEWNPLVDDGDALRLAVKLEITDLALEVGRGAQTDPYAATRCAIVRAAASYDRQRNQGSPAPAPPIKE